MAMLAGPRRKQKVINLRAKNSAWSNDSNKFGQRMLEKMGWSSGKGLGAKEDGIVEHVVARYKNDEKGLGFEDKNDQWTKHEDDFNALLANLSNGDSNEDKLHSGVSLEAKSKTSKTRVHYHKFTRGKDLTRYSEKDLANIFGKKTLKNVIEPEKEALAEEITTTEQVFQEKGSMEDYFKNKLLTLKTKVSFDNLQDEEGDSDFVFRGFAGTQDDSERQCDEGFQGFSFYDNNIQKTDNNVIQNTTEDKPKKKKKKDKSIKVNEENESINENHNNVEESSETVDEIKKKKLKSRNKNKCNELPLVVAVENSENLNEVPENEVEPVEKKKSKKKKKIEEELNDQTNELLLVEDFVPKKKKKRKNKDHAK